MFSALKVPPAPVFFSPPPWPPRPAGVTVFGVEGGEVDLGKEKIFFAFGVIKSEGSW